MLQDMRRLHPRGAANRRICVDARGAMLGPDCVLVGRTRHGFRALERRHASTLQKCVLDTAPDDHWLFRQCERISDALNKGEVALAQIYGLHIPIANLDDRTLRRLALIDVLKAGFNPDEQRVPKGEPHAGEWTTGGAVQSGTDASEGSSGDAVSFDNQSAAADTTLVPVSLRSGAQTNAGEQPAATSGSLLTVAYPGDYHDAVVQALKGYLAQNGGVVVTGVTLNAVNGMTAVADMVAKLPGAPAFIVEVKTGPGAQFTYPQMIVYPMAQVGGHVSSPNASLTSLGLAPGEPLPPLDVYVYWVVNPSQPGRMIKLPRPELVPE